MKIFCTIVIYGALLILTNSVLFAQDTIVRGMVFEEDGKTVIPFANIYVVNTGNGTVTGIEGAFELINKTNTIDTLKVSSIGYVTKLVPINTQEKNEHVIVLKNEVFNLNEAIITPGENPAHKIIRNAIEAKDRNNPQNLPDWEAKVYNKLRLDIKNFELPTNKRFRKNFGFLYNYVDSAKDKSHKFLPILISETSSKVYHSKGGSSLTEVIEASRASGINPENISQFTGQVNQDINPYSNSVQIGNINITLPLNNRALSYYRFFLYDSATVINNAECYKISFSPKHTQNNTLKGFIWIDKKELAIVRLEAKIPQKININYVTDFYATYDYIKQDEHWIPHKQLVYIDFNLTEGNFIDIPALLGHKTTYYSDLIFKDNSADIKAMKQISTIHITEQAYDNKNNESAWTSLRPQALSSTEQDIYTMVDSLKRVPLFNTLENSVELLTYGYIKQNWIEYGPYFYMWSNNKIEGNRFRLGARTTSKLSEKFRLGAHVAYGMKDEDRKYGGTFEWVINRKRFTKLHVQYTKDFETMGRGFDAISESNMLNSLISRDMNDKLSLTEKKLIGLQRDWIRGFSSAFELEHKTVYGSPFVPFITPNGRNLNKFNVMTLKISNRFAFKETEYVRGFDKRQISIKGPTIFVNLDMGFKAVEAEYNYHKLEVIFANKININPFGYSFIFGSAGRIWGDVPYPLLKLHAGNETYVFSQFSSNLMNYQEFASDEYASLKYEQHFLGYFLNKIPLIRRLELREVIGGKVIYGKMHNTHQKDILIPQDMSTLDGKPYVELNCGIENIFNLVRFDAVWRLTHKDTSNASNFGIFVSLNLEL
ncbi:MAG: DUF5686 family protein [Bacteroidales bacterium]